MRASPQFLGPMRHVKGSGFKQGMPRAFFTELPPQRRSQWSGWRGLCLYFGFCCCRCFGRPPWLQGPSYIFCLGAISDKVVRTLTDKATLLLLFINLDGSGHPYCKPPFSIVCLSEKVRNVEAGVVI